MRLQAAKYEVVAALDEEQARAAINDHRLRSGDRRSETVEHKRAVV